MRFYQTASFAILLGGLGLSALAGPALADARQDVISITQRCGGIADGRTWLDCYYGAAQPMRAQSGLPAAPAAQIRLAQSSLAGPAMADARQEVLSATQRCGGIADDRTWLDCYYGAAQPMRAQLGLPAAPAVQVRLVPPGMAAAPGYLPPPTYMASSPAAPAYGAQVPPAYGIPVNRPPAAGPTPAQQANAGPVPPPLKHNHNQGFFTSMFGGGKPIVANVRMSSYSKAKDGLFRVTLADGEIWKINDSGDYTEPKWKGPASRYVVNIYEGALGSYNFQVSDDSEIYKAIRLN